MFQYNNYSRIISLFQVCYLKCMLFKNRQVAGQLLTQELKKYHGHKQTIILAIPRGGVVIGHEMAKYLNLPLDIVVTKKIGAPFNEEFAIGAVALDGVIMVNEEILYSLGVKQDYILKRGEEIKKAIEQKIINLRGQKPLPELTGKTVILTDDGIATGYTMKAAIAYLRHKEAKKIILAIPVAPPDSTNEMKLLADEVIVLKTPDYFSAVGQFYENFEQVSDEECQTLLKST